MLTERALAGVDVAVVEGIATAVVVGLLTTNSTI
jgi:hypothetical protein